MPELPRKGALRFRMHACTKMPEMRQDRAQDRRVHKRHRASSMQNLRPKGPHCFRLPPKEAAERQTRPAFQRRRSGARRWNRAAVSSTTWQLLDLSCQSTRTMWSRCTSSSVMKTIATSGVMEAIALRHRRFSARGRGRGPRGNFCANKKRCMIKTGKPSAAISGRCRCSEALLSGSMVDM